MLATQRHFYWDPAKAVSNYRKHGVLFEEALMAIEDPLAVTRHDLDHGRAEERWVTLGEADGTLVHVCIRWTNRMTEHSGSESSPPAIPRRMNGGNTKAASTAFRRL